MQNKKRRGRFLYFNRIGSSNFISPIKKIFGGSPHYTYCAFSTHPPNKHKPEKCTHGHKNVCNSAFFLRYALIAIFLNIDQKEKIIKQTLKSIETPLGHSG